MNNKNLLITALLVNGLTLQRFVFILYPLVVKRNPGLITNYFIKIILSII